MKTQVKVAAVIPARGGSKGVPGKNLRLVAGKSLLLRAIEHCLESKFVSHVIVSSDDSETLDAAAREGVEALERPEALSSDEAKSIDVVYHALNETGAGPFDYVVLVQPTSPLRRAVDIDECAKICIQSRADSCVSVVRADQSPHLMYEKSSDNFLSPFIETDSPLFRRQDLPQLYLANGAVYFASCDWLAKQNGFVSKDTVAYEMPKSRSIDVDDESDLKMADMLLSFGSNF